MTSVEARLATLEMRQDDNTKELQSMKTTYATLENKVEEMAEKLAEMEPRLNGLIDCVAKIESDVALVERTDTNEMLTDIKTKVAQLSDDHDRVSRLETFINDVRQNFDSRLTAIEKGSSHSSGKGRRHLSQKYTKQDTCADETVLKTVFASESGSQSSQRPESVGNQASRVSAQTTRITHESDETKFKSFVVVDPQGDERSVSERLNWVEYKTREFDEIAERVQVVKFASDNNVQYTVETILTLSQSEYVYKSVTWVMMKPKEEMRKGKKVRLSACVDKLRTNGYFKEKSCTLEPCIDGDMFVYVRLCQDKEGSISMTSHIGDDQVLLATTDKKDDVSSDLCVVRMTSGQQLFLEAERLGGEAEIRWCQMLAWQIAPSPY